MRVCLVGLLVLAGCGVGLISEPPPGEPPEDPPEVDGGNMNGGIVVEDAGDPGMKPEEDAGTIVDAGPMPRDAGPPPPRVLKLDTSITSLIVEPDGSGKDDQSASYTNQNYWNFCVPGAVTAALYYWKPSNVTAWPAGSFKEPSHAPSTMPSAGTYWKSSSSSGGYSSRGRAYLMYLAMDVKPPNFTAAGVVSFASYPTTGGHLSDARDVLNWEASGHASGWSSFFYVVVGASATTQTRFHSHVVNDIVKGRPVVVFADTAYLPNWSRSLNHAITLIGYDDTASTYQYVDTCGRRCNGSSQSKNGGVWTISQSKMTQAIQNGPGYIW